MTKKHFESLALAISKSPALQQPQVLSALVDWLASQNPRFNTAQFLAACVKGGVK